MSNLIFDKINPKAFLKSLPNEPGVYQMYGLKDEILYVGKAQNLKKRVANYFQKRMTDAKTASLVQQIERIEIIITASDNEALLLENNLIKKYRPRYNILFRDDKTYPYIFLSKHVDFPRLDFHRGVKKELGRYFGPYPSSFAVRESLNLLQKLFRIRQCNDIFFQNRTRPCLQYQIQRCTAPCVNYIDAKSYQESVHLAELFLEGRNQQVVEELLKAMETASAALEFETAARIRDQVASLRKVQERQYVSKGKGNVDVIAAVSKEGHICIQVLYVRAGRMIGNRTYFPKITTEVDTAETLAAFLPQYYLNSVHESDVPEQILINKALADSHLIQQTLAEKSGHNVEIILPSRGHRARWMEMAVHNALHVLSTYTADKVNMLKRFEELQQALQLDNCPQRLECFDVSHSMGEATVASCVVFDINGPLKTDYRRFNIKDVTKGDDYAATEQALTRHYKRVKEEERSLPDILVIDGGLGQVHQAEKVLEELQVTGVLIVGLAKGPSRKPGLETVLVSGKKVPIILAPDSFALHLLQQIRDEAHRFAITGHRQQRDKRRITSSLQEISGIGVKRRQQLLRQLGGLQEVRKASVEQLASVPGISVKLAQQIYNVLHQK
ncbi:excinuclease ABC subunit UvrC [soil metagenome]